METDRPEGRGLGERLLAEDVRRHGAPRGGRDEAQAMLSALIDHELATEYRIRLAAVWAWCAVLLFVPLSGFMSYLSHTDRESLAEAAFPFIRVFVVLAVIAGLLAVVFTAVWLLRSRSLTLTAIERRLAALESLIGRER